MHRWTRYRYITRLEWCACKRVKRRDIFYIYEYLPLLCSRAAGLWQRANRELTSLSLSPSLICSFHLSPAPRSFSAPIFVPPIVLCSDPRYYSYRSFLVRSTVGIYASFSLSLSPSDTLVGNTGHTTGGQTMCHLPCHPIFRSYHDMLKARSTLTLNILYGCARLSHIYI